MQKIQRVSFLFRILFQLLFIAIPLALILFWINAPLPFPQATAPYGISMSFIPDGIEILTPLTDEIKCLGFLISLLPVGVLELILYALIKLFRHYERGEIFVMESVQIIQRIAWTLLIGQLFVNPIFEALISYVLTINNPPHHRYAQISFHAVNVGLMLMAILTILISWIMAEGCKLREEQALTI